MSEEFALSVLKNRRACIQHEIKRYMEVHGGYGPQKSKVFKGERRIADLDKAIKLLEGYHD